MNRLLAWCLLLATLAAGSYLTLYRERIYLGVSAAGYDLGGLTRAQATELLRREAAPSLAVRTMTLRSGSKLWAPTFTDLGARMDVQATTDAAFNVGRSGPLSPLLALTLLVRPATLPAAVALDHNTFNAYLARLSAETAVSPRDATVAVAGTTTYAVPAQAGRRLDVPALVTLLRTAISQGATAYLELPLTESAPTVGDSTEAARQAAKLIGAPLTLVYNDQSWTLKPTDLEALLAYRLDDSGRLSADLDKPRIQAWVARLAAEIDRPAEDARLKWDTAKRGPVVVKPSKPGLSLDAFATTDRLLQAARASLEAAGPPTTERRVVAVVAQRAPTVDSTQVDNLGIRELVWEETSLFQGSEPGRVRNIQVSAAKFDGVVIPPNGVFSFNSIVGEISAATGYDETLVILDNQTRRGAGGGVCQVSTTIFRLAFWSGFPIVERWAHAYRVSYYEQGGKPLGLEATIYTPEVDLRFKNDTGAHLLLHTVVNPNSASITVRAYGTKLAREVALDGPSILKRVPPGPPVYQEDPSVPAGQQRQVEVAREGMEIQFHRVIKHGSQVVAREKFVSDYVPTQATFKVPRRS